MDQTPPPPPPPPQNQGTSAATEEPRFEVIRDSEGNTVVRGVEFGHPDFLWVPPTSAPNRPPPIMMDKVDNDVTPSGDIVDAGNPRPTTSKKKGTASTVKKAPKRSSKPKGGKKTPKSKRPPRPAGGAAASEDDEDEESDNGPYCICRGPDDHRWMISCEKCEDWFHGECVDLDKVTGETLVEKFICPNCSDGRRFVTRYKKMCSLDGCRQPARVYSAKDSSVFCSDEHAHLWWDRIVSSLPRRVAVPPSSGDALTQEDFMAILSSDLGGFDEESGTWKLAKHPFIREVGLQRQYTTKDGGDVRNGDVPIKYLTDEEEVFVLASASDRYMLAEEIVLCKKMLQLLEMANDRLKAAIAEGSFSSEICGYDNRLDSVSVQHAFAAFCKTDEGIAIFKAGKLGDPTGQDDDESAVRGMCERKRCKPHYGWYNMLTRAIRAQIKDLTAAAKEKLDQESDVKEAAEERFYRRMAEGNRVEVLDEGPGKVANGVDGMPMDIDGA
ncbi:uncharacterized protein DNG_02818 [Cephalotrichum gorgonifer]|uniref:PHD-type domain-containing protein n=1 Tax=Cephalotrichum gorgonifer TaxID=2041049 RepID=A0AAE8SSZ6_9PEZI|nr:uncharacterized protein DNG_02818 [Cephalotrichum gorgonifer]